MKKLLLTAFVAIGIGVLTSLQFVGADPVGVLFLKRTDSFVDDTRINQNENSVLEFDIINGYGTDAIISNVTRLVTDGVTTFTGSGFSFTDNITSLLIGAGETKRVTMTIDPVDTNTIDSTKFGINDLALVSGSGVYLDSGSGLSIADPLEGALFNIFPDNYGIKDSVDFTTPTTFNEDISLPINFGTRQFTFVAETRLEPETTIPGVTDGLEVIIPAGTMITGSGSWYGQINAPEILDVPSSINFSNITPQKRISVGVDGESLMFSSPVRISIPVIGTGTRRVYSSQDGITWTYETTCTISANICSFTVNHFTQYLVGSENESENEEETIINNSKTTIGGGSSYSYSSSSGGQNAMRHGNYDPNKQNNNLNKNISPEINTIIHNRSTKYLRNFIPCEVDEDAILTNRLNELRLLQGAPRKCKEDANKYLNLPYGTYQR